MKTLGAAAATLGGLILVGVAAAVATRPEGRSGAVGRGALWVPA